MPTRLISFAGSTVAIEHDGAQAAHVVAFLYRHVPHAGAGAPHVTFRLLSGGESGRMVLYRGERLLYDGDSAADVANLLLGDSCHELADQSHDGLLFHAAALARRGKGLILPGTIGAGKSTLAAWLLARGFDYLTDELVFVAPGAGGFQAFTRPLNLKPPARAILQRQFDFEGQSRQLFSGSQFDLVPPSLINPRSRMSEPDLSLILFPRYLSESAFELQRLSKAQAGLELMQCLVNARNLPDYGFSEITRLARKAPAYQMSYAGFDQVGEAVETMLDTLDCRSHYSNTLPSPGNSSCACDSGCATSKSR
jgi:hypothetical protein